VVVINIEAHKSQVKQFDQSDGPHPPQDRK